MFATIRARPPASPRAPAALPLASYRAYASFTKPAQAPLPSPSFRKPSPSRTAARPNSALSLDPLTLASAVSASSSPPSVHRRADALFRLDPSRLAHSTDHLKDVKVSRLLLTYFVYLGCASSQLVTLAEHGLKAVDWVKRTVPVFGPGLFAAVMTAMKHTGFKQFCGGETTAECTPLIQHLSHRGVATLYDFAAEAETPLDGSAAADSLNAKHVDELLGAIAAASSPLDGLAKGVGAHSPNWVAIKLSGLLNDPEVLLRASSVLVSNAPSTSTPWLSGRSSLTQTFSSLSQSDLTALQRLHEALRQCCQLASYNSDGRVRLTVDAEQSWFQPVIDHFHLLLAREFNSASATPIVYNTIQAYLRSAEPSLAAHLQDARSRGYALGVKLVRGAYMEAEADRAEAKGVQNPNWSTKVETDACYDACAATLVEAVAHDLRTAASKAKSGVAFMLAGHNAASARKMIGRGRELGLYEESSSIGAGGEMVPTLRPVPGSEGRIAFGQLLGMADNLTFALADTFKAAKEDKGDAALPMVIKYMPYGAVHLALPYLIRRAQENKSIMSGPTGAANERRLIVTELKRRIGA